MTGYALYKVGCHYASVLVLTPFGTICDCLDVQDLLALNQILCIADRPFSGGS